MNTNNFLSGKGVVGPYSNDGAVVVLQQVTAGIPCDPPPLLPLPPLLPILVIRSTKSIAATTTVYSHSHAEVYVHWKWNERGAMTAAK
ncbi:hypothetical protein L2E82_35777 [Cichorium intybus]|uniref:Uncharacterized protein n=1 Tax=Cichorium intybus TaxID=13427 RepID=A0ACB9BQ07_CICIN|nr:hypothetical protein L2E82_35777 [Cichorium intybus]